MMNADIKNLSDILKFLDYLRVNSIKFDIKHSRPDSLMVTFVQIYFRVEVDFFDDHIEFSYFIGDERVKDDLHLLDSLIREEPPRLRELGILPESVRLG